jgi:Ras GTPase-activating-like protein IQGAP2/3
MLVSSPSRKTHGLRSTPETFDIVSSTIDVSSRKNLAQISRVLTQITTGTVFSESAPSYIPINDYVSKAISQLGAWLIEGGALSNSRDPLLTAFIVATVPDAETEYHASEFLDATVQPKPIYISPNEVYATQSLLSEHLQHIVGVFVHPFGQDTEL